MRNKLLILLLLFISFGSTHSWASTLSNVANSMQPGTWAQLNSNGFDSNYLRYPNGPNTNITTQFFGEGTWDPTSKKVLFLGAGHYNYSQLHVYSESSNTWTRGQTPRSSAVGFGHGYNHNAIDINGRVLGFIYVKPTEILFKQYNIGANIWTEAPPTSNDGGIAHALVYFPERSKWYVADGTFGRVREYDRIANSWSTHAANVDCFGGKGRYHQFASYNSVRKEIVFGGGNASSGANIFSTSWCKMNANGDITVMPPSPHTLRIPEGGNPTKGSLITIDPVSGDLLILTQDGKFYAFNFSTNKWTAINDQATRPAGLKHTSRNVSNGFVVPINTYGVVMYADYNGNNSTIWLYKHAQGGTVITPPSEDTTSPSTPTGVGGSSTSESTITLSWQASTDNIGVAGYQVLRGGKVIANPSGTSYNDTALEAATTYSYKVQAFDSSGNFSTASSSVNVKTRTGSVVPPPPPPPPPPGDITANTIRITDTSGNNQSNRSISIGRAFRKGEISQYAKAEIDGTPVQTQCDVKNRWDDGSLQYAIVSFVVPFLSSGGSIDVEFVEQSSGNNTGFLTQAQMLDAGYNFDASIQMVDSTTQTVKARTILENGKFRYWLKGPIVTAVIIEDRTPSRTYDKDFGDGSKALHPIFEAWFYPQGKKIDIGYTVENIWASSTTSKGMRDLRYSFTLKSGHTSPTLKFSQPSFLHIGKTRWHKRYWQQAEPGTVRIDHNLKYMVTTGAVPHYDTSLTVSDSLIRSRYSLWEKRIGEGATAITGSSNRLGLWSKNWDAAGASDWIGPMATWDTLYLLTMHEDDRMHEVVFEGAKLSGRFPINFREADQDAGTGDFFDASYSSIGGSRTGGSVDTFGRVISVNARRTTTLSSYSDGNAASGDRINKGSVTRDGFPGDINSSHWPDLGYLPYLLSGRYYYLETLQFQAAYRIGYKLGAYGGTFSRQGEAGFLNDSTTRGDAWGFRTVAYAAFLSPDGSAEKDYFEDKLKNNIAEWEGILNLSKSYPSKIAEWNYGRTKRAFNDNWLGAVNGTPSPLGQLQTHQTALVQAPLKQDGTLRRGNSPWSNNFLTIAWGLARQFGYKTDTLLQFVAKHAFHINLDNTPSNLHNFIEAYRYPTVFSDTGTWAQNYTEWVSGFNPDIQPATGRRSNLTSDHSYSFIALAANSFFTPYTVDGLSGVNSWNAISADTPHQDRFETQSPKWAITPMGSEDGGGTTNPPDGVPPSAPRNLSLE